MLSYPAAIPLSSRALNHPAGRDANRLTFGQLEPQYRRLRQG
ncbi:hypothetical protein OG559_23245 [Micromonospora sp. NBC_01405]